MYVMLFVVIDFSIAALAVCLCGWLIRSARHGTADNDDGHGDDATRLRVFGGACWSALAADVRFGARSACVRVQTSCWWRPRWWRPLCCGTGGRGWVGGWAGANAVCSRHFVVVLVADVCGCRPAGLGMYVSVYDRSQLLAASDVWGHVVFR